MRHIEGNRGIGSIAMMVVAIAAMTLVRTFRWNELGLLDHIMIGVLWIAVAGGATAIGITFWRYARLRAKSSAAGRQQVRHKERRSIYRGFSSRADDAAAGEGPPGFGGL